MSRPQAFFNSDPEGDTDDAFPFAPFGIVGGDSYFPWTDAPLDYLWLFIIWFLTDEITLTLTLHNDGITPFDKVCTIVLKRVFVPADGVDREDYLLYPGSDDEDMQDPPDFNNGAFRWQGSTSYGTADIARDDFLGDPAGDPNFNSLIVECEADLFGLGDLTTWAPFATPYPKPQERYIAEDDEYNATFRAAIKIKIDRGTELEFYIQSMDPSVHVGDTITGGGLNPPIESTATFDGGEFESWELGQPTTLFTAPSEWRLDTSLWFGYAPRGGAQPPGATYITATGAVSPGHNPETDETD